MPLPFISAADLAARYPAFAGVDPALVTLVLDEARSAVADTWIAADQKPALLAYTAHRLALEGHDGGLGDGGGHSVPIGEETMSVSGPVETVEVGDTKVKFADANGATMPGAAAVTGSGFEATIYGRYYLELLRRSQPAVWVA
ncbi:MULTISPECIES: DUF4054 domain-containing protein [unclassified Beijerinckia]|uniref:DUF4054 domain-containing protein n=1 Tax=unclassified Beijerinckia TaxID=2638183 RepID=UPI00089AF55F|nr:MULTISPECIES: DUF4054 domain-containing protein [unclassified Beijerinckia]MDH7794114.1 hypothetical protein [Beijerinckia sp. GAS462]SEB53613.1 Protein of unknown function [Beijerinckia sp. 28-YEA-48]